MNKGIIETRKDAVKMIGSIERRRSIKVIINAGGRGVDIILLMSLHHLIHQMTVIVLIVDAIEEKNLVDIDHRLGVMKRREVNTREEDIVLRHHQYRLLFLPQSVCYHIYPEQAMPLIILVCPVGSGTSQQLSSLTVKVLDRMRN